ncbi:hypothetical protein LSF60_10575 [Rhodococcus pyridinivorans]|nr:hypothetical protein [Rhodococcus pyridinivorans]UGQ59871.1 hypothetical protein LSF60_10575 [Rhodococcus pyridinivorans]
MTDLEIFLAVLLVIENAVLLATGYRDFTPRPPRDSFGENATKAMRRAS